jgi:hypothetical protein
VKKKPEAPFWVLRKEADKRGDKIVALRQPIKEVLSRDGKRFIIMEKS